MNPVIYDYIDRTDAIILDTDAFLRTLREIRSLPEVQK